MKITAHVPTQQYGYIELADLPDDVSEIERLYNKYAEKPIKLPTDNFRRLKAFCGGEIDYDEVNHVYSWNGEVYQSGSQYADSLKPPFDKQKIAEATAKRDGTNVEDILAKWELKGKSSRDLGSAIHEALELFEHYGVLHDHPLLKHATQTFYEAHKDEKAYNEVVVVDHAQKQAGRIDRLLVVDNKKGICRIQDFKTGATVKDLEYYWEQLSFYANILLAGGWEVEGLDIFHYNGKWTTYRSEDK